MKRAAKAHKIPASLLHAIISAESSYNPEAVSKAGAVGLMQLMPATASRYGVKDRKDPIDSIKGGSRYFRHLICLTMILDWRWRPIMLVKMRSLNTEGNSPIQGNAELKRVWFTRSTGVAEKAMKVPLLVITHCCETSVFLYL